MLFDQWMENLFDTAGRKMWDERVQRLLDEFWVLGDAITRPLAPENADDVGDM